jgi:hypothetical protein
MDFGKISAVSIREVWPNEASDFTPWLAANLDVLSEKLGMELVHQATEAPAGDFAADIIAEDISTNRKIVIENQYGSTDHRHLGQLITYSSALGASAVVWIAETIRPEHKAALDFLNLNLKATLQLYALEAAVIKIDDSKPAYTFNIVCMPTESDIAEIGGGQALSETKLKYKTFFQGLLDDLRDKYQFTKARAAQPQSWYSFRSENSKLFTYMASFAQGARVRVEVYIDTGNKIWNKALFDVLNSQKAEIEQAYGHPLSWERLDAKRACRVAVYRDGSIDLDTEQLEEIRNWIETELRRIKQVFPAFVASAAKIVDTPRPEESPGEVTL